MYREEVDAFDDIGLFLQGAAALTGEAEPEQVRTAEVTANVFRILGVEPARGRNFAPQEEVTGNDKVIILSYRLWQRRYGGDPAILGRTVRMDGQSRTVIGVMPEGFRMPLDFGGEGITEAWLPLPIAPEDYDAQLGPSFAYAGGSHTFFALARLAPGATVEQANAELLAITQRLASEGRYPDDWRFRATAVPITEEITGELRAALLVLFAAGGMVLLVACANLAGLMLVRGENRRREISLRTALGAGRGRLLRQFLTESLLVALLGGVLGLYLATFGVSLAKAFAPASLPRVVEASIEWPVVAFTFGLSILTPAAFGLIPALHVTRVAPAEILKEGGRAPVGEGMRFRIRQAIVTGEIALAVVLTIGAVLMGRSIWQLLRVDPGFRGERVLTMQLSTPAVTYPDAADVSEFYDELLRRIRSLPDVESAAAMRILPLATEMGDRGLEIEGYKESRGRHPKGDWQVVTPDLFETLRIRLVDGRSFNEGDHGRAAPAVIINETFARTYFPRENPIGQRMRLRGDPNLPWSTVAGVVGDLQHNSLTERVKEQFYVPLAQWAAVGGTTPRTMSLVIRTSSDPAHVVRSVRERLRALDPLLAVAEVRTMQDILGASIARQRFTALLLVLFSGLALLLALVGIYGVVSYAVSARTYETRIRLALGARSRDVVLHSLRDGIVQTVAGVSIGVGVALHATRSLSAFVYGVSTHDALTFVGVALGASAASMLASFVPAYRAAFVDPAVVLRGK